MRKVWKEIQTLYLSHCLQQVNNALSGSKKRKYIGFGSLLRTIFRFVEFAIVISIFAAFINAGYELTGADLVPFATVAIPVTIVMIWVRKRLNSTILLMPYDEVEARKNQEMLKAKLKALTDV